MNSIPLISIIMPVYNEERWLSQSIPSILNQTCEDFEFIILNDASTDNSDRIIKNYTTMDSRIRTVNNPDNYGLIKTLNRGVDLAGGKYIARMDSDDISFPDRLEKQLNFMEVNPEIHLVGTGREVIDEDGEILSKTRRSFMSPTMVKWCLMFKNVFSHGSIFCRNQLLKRNKYAAWAVNGEDYELWVRINNQYQFARLPDILYKRRTHANSISNNNKTSICKIGYRISRRQMRDILGENIDQDIVGYLTNCKLKNNYKLLPLVRSCLLLRRIENRFVEKNRMSRDEEKRIRSWTNRHGLKIIRNTIFSIISHGRKTWKRADGEPNAKYLRNVE